LSSSSPILLLLPLFITMSDVTDSSSSTPIVTVHTESSTNLPMGFKLNGSNYEIWASMIELHATTQGKLGYLTGDTDAPDSKDPKFGKWKIVDAVVKSWMLRTMEPSLLNMFHTLTTAKEIWDAVNQMFYDGSDISQLYELRCQVRSDILRSDKVPSIENVFFMVRREAQRQITVLGSGTKIGEPAVVFGSKNTSLVSQRTGKRQLKCDHCGEKRHTIDTCWALNGVPDWEKERRHLKKEHLDSKAHVVVAPTSVADHLTATPPPTLTAVASTPTPPLPGNFGKAFHAHDTWDTGWIIDSGATDHMTYNSALFSTTIPPHRDHVLTANNVADPVTGASSILLTPALPLDKVFLVPSLISRLGRSLVVVLKKGGLYYVDDVATSRALRAGRAETSQHRRIWLLHYRFGHAPFGYLRHLFPALFSSVNDLSLESSTFTSFGFPYSYAGTDPSYLCLFYVDSVSKGVWLCFLCSPPSESEERNRGVPPDRYSPKGKARYAIAHYVSDHRLSPECKAFVTRMDNIKIPTRGTKPVGCRWVFTVKYNADATVERYKAILVAKGLTHTYGVDYHDTFAPVAKMNTIRVLLSLAVNLDWTLRQFDVKNAFLHGELEEEVYMSLPPRYRVTGETGNVCKLKKALYGLKQSSRACFGRFTTTMKKFGYRQANTDHTLFIKHRAGKVTLLIIYVDDMIVTGDDTVEIEELQKRLASEFEMKDLGSLKYFLGVEVTRSKHGLFLSQRKYVMDLLADTGMLDCKPADTPIVENHKLGVYVDQVPTNRERYQRLVGRLIYLSLTRPDIAYVVSVASQFMHSPSEDHMAAVMRIMSYLKSAPGRGLLFKKNGHLDLEGYTDADYAGNITDRRSTSGYFTFVGGNLVTWRSKKQNVVSRSSAESEYRGIAQGVCEILWLRWLLAEIGFRPNAAIKLHCDNQSAFEITNNSVQHDRTKHVEVDRHFIKEKLEHKLISIPFVPSSEQLADVLTYAVSKRRFEDSLDKLGITDIYAPT
ncbi:unnamed protein product, partial [Prunus brigantina]